MENKLSKIIYFVTPYALISSLLYLLGYWSTFDLNILEFISISDIIRLSIYPIAVSVIFVIIGAVVGAYYSACSDTPMKKSTKYVSYIGILIIACIAHYRGHPMWWLVIGLFLAEIIYHGFYKLNLLETFIPNQRAQRIVLWILIAVPILSFSFGKMHSNEILDGKKAQYVNVSIFKNQESFRNQEHLKYIGLKGDYFFFLSIDNAKLYISKSSEVPILELQKSIPKEKKKSNRQKTKDTITNEKLKKGPSEKGM
ncbi:MAG TPA: hypothetical protein VMW10_09995 [Alphaproteobacteria bacterium]|nr:hypothetical protein [Alphaproteobacteria bacterium]